MRKKANFFKKGMIFECDNVVFIIKSFPSRNSIEFECLNPGLSGWTKTVAQVYDFLENNNNLFKSKIKLYRG